MKLSGRILHLLAMTSRFISSQGEGANRFLKPKEEFSSRFPEIDLSMSNTTSDNSRLNKLSENCSDVEARPGKIGVYILDDGALASTSKQPNTIVYDMGSSIPNPGSNISALGALAEQDVDRDKVAFQAVLDAMDDIPDWVLDLSGALSSDTVRSLQSNPYAHGNSDTCDLMRNCFGDDVPYGPRHALNTYRIILVTLYENFPDAEGLEDLREVMNLYWSEISTCWPTHEGTLVGLDKVVHEMSKQPENPAVVLIPAGTGVETALEDKDCLGDQSYQSIVEMKQRMDSINPINFIFAAAGTRFAALDNFLGNLFADELLDLLDVSSACITPANSPVVYAIAPVNQDGTCSSLAWSPRGGQDIAAFAYRGDPDGRHTQDGENTSSGATAKFAADFIVFLNNVRLSLPEEAQSQIMTAVLNTLDPIIGPSDGCGPGIANLDDAFNYLLNEYQDQLPTSMPSAPPSDRPTAKPSASPSKRPSAMPSESPTGKPTSSPSVKPSDMPSVNPTIKPTAMPSVKPSDMPSVSPTSKPTVFPSVSPTSKPTVFPSVNPTSKPTALPTSERPVGQTNMPSQVSTSDQPTLSPTKTNVRTEAPTSPGAVLSDAPTGPEKPTGTPQVSSASDIRNKIVSLVSLMAMANLVFQV